MIRSWIWGTGIFPWRIGVFPWLLFIVAIELVLKGIALYRAARNGQKYWFIAILVLNTLGILPLIYLLFFAKKRKK